MSGEHESGRGQRTVAALVRSPTALAVFAGLVAGIADDVFIETNIDGSRFIPYATTLTWIFIPLIWVTLCLSVASVFSIPGLRRHLKTALAVAGPGLLLISRSVPIIRGAIGVSVPVASAIILTIVALTALFVWRLMPACPAFEVRVIVLALAGIAGLAWYSQTPVRLPAPVGEAPVGQKNIVLIFLDTVRYDDALQMSAVRHLSTRAAVFDNAWSQASWTLPSHFSVLTGIDPWAVRYDRARLRFEPVGLTLAQVLGAHGYTTAGVFANPLLRRGSGCARGLQQADVAVSCVLCGSGIVHIIDRVCYHAGFLSPVCAWYTAPEVTVRAVDFVSHARRPYFLALNYMDAHGPYYVEPRCGEVGRPTRISEADTAQQIDALFGKKTISVAVAGRLHEQYRASIRCLDRSLSALLASLEREPDAGNTIVALIADHGEQFGEHSMIGHGNSLYRQVLHVPMLLSVPGRPAQRISDPVSISNLYPTLLHSVGISNAGLGLLDADRRPPVAYYRLFLDGLPLEPAFSIASSRYHLIAWKSGREELYAYRDDPEELHPLPHSDDPEVAQLRHSLLTAASREDSQAAAFNSLGYLQ
jgi:arylsulfatase A-like enzyme